MKLLFHWHGTLVLCKSYGCFTEIICWKLAGESQNSVHLSSDDERINNIYVWSGI